MNKFMYLVLAMFFAAIGTGCASGTKYSEMKKDMPSLSAQQGRVYFYRTAVVGMAVQPAVKLNGEKVGTAKPQGFFFVDRPAGTYEVSATTEVTRRLSLAIDPGQTRYVRLNMNLGAFVGHVSPELVDPAKGEKEIANCSYIGNPLPTPGGGAGAK